jgi:hypothetical protein
VKPSATVAAAVAAVSLAGMAGCGERHRVDHHIWTLLELQAALHDGRSVATGPTFPAGRPASDFLSAGSGFDTLKVVPAFSEGQPAAYVTTEIWINYDDVWLQPGYVQVTDPTSPDPFLRYPDGRRAPVLFDVGPESTFYSPFWQLALATVGPLSDADHYRSTRALREAGVPTQSIDPHACPLRPLDPPVLASAPGEHPKEPTWGTELADVPMGEAWIDGRRLGLFDFGAGIFTAEAYEDAGTVVEPVPFFLFYGAAGDATPLAGALEVAGVRSLFDEGGEQPRSGAFWRIHKAVLPPGAGPYASATPGVEDWNGRVALDTTCFAAATFPDACSWLDSQEKIQDALGEDRITATEILTTRPWVFYDKKPVAR